jgi:hypothetical protein
VFFCKRFSRLKKGATKKSRPFWQAGKAVKDKPNLGVYVPGGGTNTLKPVNVTYKTMHVRKMKTLFVLIACSLYITVFVSCINSRREQEEIFMDYRISAEEGNDSVSIIIQFHSNDIYGPIVGIDTPGYVMLDGQKLSADSSSITGPFYPANREVRSFTGKHNIIFVDAEGKKVKEEFSFQPFSLLNKMQDTLARKPFNLDFRGLSETDYVRIILTDTTFPGEGVNRVDTVTGNRSRITRDDISRLESGPIQLELIKEAERTIENGDRVTGMISVLYTIRREFFLR